MHRGGLAARGMLLVAVLGLLVLGSLVGFDRAGSRAYAQEPALVLFGFVRSGDSPMPSRVRATIGDVACGSADIIPISPGVGSYALTVVSSDTKPGCGVYGAAVRVSLSSGAIDPGVWTKIAAFEAGAVTRLDLSTDAPIFTGGFMGTLPDGPGTALLVWSGPSGTPVEQAIATVARDVEAVYFWDATRQEYREYIVGGDASVQTLTLVDANDVVIVSIR